MTTKRKTKAKPEVQWFRYDRDVPMLFWLGDEVGRRKVLPGEKVKSWGEMVHPPGADASAEPVDWLSLNGFSPTDPPADDEEGGGA